MKVAEDLHDESDVGLVEGVVLVEHAKVLARPVLDVLQNLKKNIFIVSEGPSLSLLYNANLD